MKQGLSRLLIAIRIIGRSIRNRFLSTIGSVLESLCELFKQESAFKAHFHDCSVETGFALTGGIVGFFDVVQAALELDALSVVGFFY